MGIVFEKKRLGVAISDGIAAGTSSIIDTTDFNKITVTTYGTTGSCNVAVFINGGTVVGTGATAFPASTMLGSHLAIGAATDLYFRVSEFYPLTDQAIIRHGAITGTFTTCYNLHD